MAKEAEPDWVLNAEAALAAAQAMPAGSARVEALRAAGVLRNAAIERKLDADPEYNLRKKKTAPPGKG